MLRQASSRNHRSKGFKVKHTLQICVLLAICIWLLYQVKHSHEKKRAFEERNSKMSSKVTEYQADFFKFGRKDLPHAEKTGSVNESHNKEDEDEETQEGEHDIKQEEIEDEEGRGAGDDEIDEQDQDKGDEESGHGEESTDEEDKDSREEDKDSRDKDGHDGVGMFDNQEHEGGTQEAREENYKRDDASSAVHDAHETESETGSGGAANADEEQVVDKVDDDSGANGSKHNDDSSVNGAKGDGANTDGSKGEVVAENVEKKLVESENVTNGSDDGSRGDNDLSAGSGGASVSNVSDTVVIETIQTGYLSSNVTAADIKDVEVDNKDVDVEFSKPDNGTVSNSTAVEGNNQMEQQTNLTTVAESNTQMELQTNLTGASDHQIEMQNISMVVDPAGISTSNDTASFVSAQNQNIVTDNATPAEDAHNSQNVEEQAEKSYATPVLESKEHSTASTTDENEDAAQGGSDNSEHAAITEELKDARMDLSTLPDIQNKAKMTDDEAAE